MRDLRRWIYAGLATFLVGGVLGLAGAGNFIAGAVGVMVFVAVYSALQRMDGNRNTAVRDAAERAAALALFNRLHCKTTGPDRGGSAAGRQWRKRYSFTVGDRPYRRIEVVGPRS